MHALGWRSTAFAVPGEEREQLGSVAVWAAGRLHLRLSLLARRPHRLSGCGHLRARGYARCGRGHDRDRDCGVRAHSRGRARDGGARRASANGTRAAFESRPAGHHEDRNAPRSHHAHACGGPGSQGLVRRSMLKNSDKQGRGHERMVHRMIAGVPTLLVPRAVAPRAPRGFPPARASPLVRRAAALHNPLLPVRVPGGPRRAHGLLEREVCGARGRNWGKCHP